MSTVLTKNELESYLWNAAVILRGLIDAGDYKQFAFPLIFFKRLSDVIRPCIVWLSLICKEHADA